MFDLPLFSQLAMTCNGTQCYEPGFCWDSKDIIAMREMSFRLDFKQNLVSLEQQMSIYLNPGSIIYVVHLFVLAIESLELSWANVISQGLTRYMYLQ